MTIDITNHHLVPKHSKVSDTEKQKVFDTFNITSKRLPKIHLEDPAIAKLSIKIGDVIKIERKSKTAGIASYYRVVIDGWSFNSNQEIFWREEVCRK